MVVLSNTLIFLIGNVHFFKELKTLHKWIHIRLKFKFIVNNFYRKHFPKKDDHNLASTLSKKESSKELEIGRLSSTWENHRKYWWWDRKLKIFHIWIKHVHDISFLAIDEVIIDKSWIKTMKEELSRFEKNHVWNLVSNPHS